MIQFPWKPDIQEMYGVFERSPGQDQIGGTLAGFDIEHGMVKNLHLHVLLPSV